MQVASLAKTIRLTSLVRAQTSIFMSQLCSSPLRFNPQTRSLDSSRSPCNNATPMCPSMLHSLSISSPSHSHTLPRSPLGLTLPPSYPPSRTLSTSGIRAGADSYQHDGGAPSVLKLRHPGAADSMEPSAVPDGSPQAASITESCEANTAAPRFQQLSLQAIALHAPVLFLHPQASHMSFWWWCNWV